MTPSTPGEYAALALGYVINFFIVAGAVALAGATWPVAWLAALYLTIAAIALLPLKVYLERLKARLEAAVEKLEVELAALDDSAE